MIVGRLCTENEGEKKEKKKIGSFAVAWSCLNFPFFSSLSFFFSFHIFFFFSPESRKKN